MPREQLRHEIHFESLMLLTEKIVALKQKKEILQEKDKQTDPNRSDQRQIIGM